MAGAISMKQKQMLPKITLTVPQKERPPLPIPLIEPTELCKTIGVKTNLASDGKAQLKYTKDKRTAWAKNLHSHKYIRPSDGWQSLTTQLKPSVTRGLVCLEAETRAVSKIQTSIHHKMLGPLGIHCSIRWELRTWSEQYGGLVMFDLDAEQLGKKIYFLKRHWRNPEVMGRTLRRMFEVFRVTRV